MEMLSCDGWNFEACREVVHLGTTGSVAHQGLMGLSIFLNDGLEPVLGKMVLGEEFGDVYTRPATIP